MAVDADPQAAFQPPLNETLRRETDEELCTLLDKRTADLGIATLPTASMLLLKQLLSEVGLTMASQVFGPHPATLHAWEKQKLLPWGTHVQKTTTLRIGRKSFLFSSIGNQRFGENEQFALVEYLGLSRSEARQVTINPQDIKAESLGFRQGNVSLFLQDDYWEKLHALVQLAWPPLWGDQNVAITIDPWHTVLLPLRFYGRVLCRYVPQHVAIYFLDGGEVIVTSGRRL